MQSGPNSDEALYDISYVTGDEALYRQIWAHGIHGENQVRLNGRARSKSCSIDWSMECSKERMMKCSKERKMGCSMQIVGVGDSGLDWNNCFFDDVDDDSKSITPVC